MHKKRFIALSIAITFFMSLPRVETVSYDKKIEEYHSQIESKGKELDDIQKKLSDMQKTYEDCIAEEKRIKNTLSKTDEKLISLKKNIQEYSEKIIYAQQEYNRLAKEIETLSSAKSLWEQSMSQAAADYYVDLLAYRDANVTDVLRQCYKKCIVMREACFIQAADSDILRTCTLQKNVAVNRKKLEGKVTRSVSEKEQLASMKNKQSHAYRTVKNQAQQSHEDLLQLEESAQMLQTLINDLEQKKKESEQAQKRTAAAQRKMIRTRGDLPWPIIGKIISPFGKVKHEQLDTYVYNNGVTIAPNSSCDVHAVSKGKIVFAGTFGGYENMVIIDHQSGFFSVYGYLEKITVVKGTVVEGYAIIGSVAASGGVLYFELRKGNQPEDPLTWLKR